jgi:dynein heavy chain
VGSNKNLDLIINELTIVQKLWNHIKRCNLVFHSYLSLQYVKINPVDMEDEVKTLRKQLMDIKGVDRKSNTFMGINEDIKKWATFMPLLNELKDPSMLVEDGRHWAKVKTLVKKEFSVDDNLVI